MKTRKYSELKNLQTLKERFDYLKLSGEVGKSTFGFDRYLNQAFYRSPTWKKVRDFVIIRDNGCDLGIMGEEVFDSIVVHHMNPISIEQIEDHDDDLLNPEFLICCRNRTHNAIHFSDEKLLPKPLVLRRPNDTCPWK